MEATHGARPVRLLGAGLRTVVCACTAWLLALAAPGALANVIYAYYGSTFTTATGPYTTNDNIQGQILLASELPFEQLLFGPVTPLAFRFLDGVNVIESAHSNIVSALFEFRTTEGRIADWRFSIVADDGGASVVMGSVGGIGSYRGDMVDQAMTGGQYDGIVTSSPGAWSVTVSPVPEPGTLGLVALALVGMGYAAQRRMRGSAPHTPITRALSPHAACGFPLSR